MSGADGCKKRIDWIDFAKGFTMLLVVIGHSTGTSLLGMTIHQIIFSFHMPLFFVLSGMTFKPSDTVEEFKEKIFKNIKNLLIPFLITYIIFLLKDYSLFYDIEYWKSAVFTFLFAGVGAKYYGVKASWLYTWFLVALFTCKVLFDYLHLKTNNRRLFLLCICIGSVIGAWIGANKKIPFSIDIALASEILICFGFYYKKRLVSEKPLIKLLMWLIIWGITFLCIQTDYSNLRTLDMSLRGYPCYPICFLTGISGTMVILEFSFLVCSGLKVLSKSIIYLGKNSLYFLCIHTLDIVMMEWWFSEDSFILGLKRILLDILVFVLVMGIRKIVKNYSQKIFKLV